MSRLPNGIDFVIEWSPSMATVFDPAVAQERPYGSLGMAVEAMGHSKTVRVAISRRSSFIKAVRVPDASRAEVVQMLTLTASSHLPLPASEIAFDIRLTEDVNDEGRLAVIGAVRSEDLKVLNAQLMEAGWVASDILPAAAGSILVAIKAGQRDCAIVQKSAEGWSIDLVFDGELRYSRTLPSNLPAESLEEEVNRTFAAAQLPLAPIVAAGGLSLPFVSVRANASSLELLASPQADELGLHVELPEIVLARRARARSNRLRAAWLMVAGAAALAVYAYSDRAGLQAKVNQQIAIWQIADRKTTNLKSNVDALVVAGQAMQKDLDRGFRPAQRVSDVLTVVSNAAPQGVWLSGIGFERGKPLLIRGTAINSEAVTSYVNALSAEKRLRDVRLVFANNGTIEQRPVVQFSISGFAVGNLPLNDNPTPGRPR